jgi:branched-chain amino acid transport system substrate-binding protein
MVRDLTKILLQLLVVILLLGCERASVKTESGAGVIKIGVILTKTGPSAWLGESEEKAIRLYVDQLNSIGGINGRIIELIVVDDEGKPEVASRVAERLVRDGVVAIIGPSLTPTSLAVEQIIARERVPMISMSGGYQPRGDRSPWGWSVVGGAFPAMERIVLYMRERGLRRLATITPTDPLGDQADQGLKILLEDRYKGDPVWVGHEKFNLQDVDITPQLIKLKAANPDIIFAGASGEYVVTIRKQMNQVGLERVPLATFHSNAVSQVLKVLGDTPGQLLVPGTAVNAVDDLPESPVKSIAIKFATAFEQRYREPPMTVEGIGHDSIHVVVEAIRAAGPSRASIQQCLHQGQRIIGVSGEFKYTPEDHVGLDYTHLFMLQSDKGRWRLVK